jgi:ribosomal protein S18 acetylase RimI-like enzyme
MSVPEKPKPARRRRKAALSPVEIRGMKLEDLPAVFALGQKLFTAEDFPTLYRCWDEDEVMQLFSADHETCLVAEADEKIVGFALGGIMKKPRNAWLYAWLEWLGVDPTVKRHGIATRLLNQLTTLFIKREARIILVDTDAGNYKALSFFRKNGFGHEIKHVYLSRNIDDHPLAIERKEALREDDEE